jgi:hypothetical protein
MRTRECSGVYHLTVARLEPRVEIFVTYDGLGGLPDRSILADIVYELQRQSLDWFKVLDAIKQHGGRVGVSFLDYVSYGVGGGDATAEFPYGRMMLLWYEDDKLLLRRNPPLVPADDLPATEREVEILPIVSPVSAPPRDGQILST